MDEAGLGGTDDTDEAEEVFDSFLRCTGMYTPEVDDEELDAREEGRSRLRRSKSMLGIDDEVEAAVLFTE